MGSVQVDMVRVPTKISIARKPIRSREISSLRKIIEMPAAKRQPIAILNPIIKKINPMPILEPPKGRGHPPPLSKLHFLLVGENTVEALTNFCRSILAGVRLMTDGADKFEAN